MNLRYLIIFGNVTAAERSRGHNVGRTCQQTVACPFIHRSGRLVNKSNAVLTFNFESLPAPGGNIRRFRC